MNFQPTTKQALVIWNLLITGDEPAMSKVKPELKPKERQPLIDAGLIELVKRGHSSHIVLTDKAWDWAIENFAVELPEQSHFAVLVFYELLKKIGAYLQQKKISLGEILRCQDIPDEPLERTSESVPIAPLDLETRIRQAYLQASGGEYVVRVRLAQLRQLLPDVPREILDKTLIQMELARKVTLMHLDDPQEIRSADEQAVLNIGGHTNHIVYMGQ